MAVDHGFVDLAGRDGRGGHVEQPPSARNRHADRICSEARLAALPWRNHRRGVAHHDPDQPLSRVFLRPERRRAEMVGLAGHHHRHAVLFRDADTMRAADFRDPLSDSVFSVVEQARAHLGDHVTVGDLAHVARLQLLDVVGQQLDSMRIDAAEIGFHQ